MAWLSKYPGRNPGLVGSYLAYRKPCSIRDEDRDIKEFVERGVMMSGTHVLMAETVGTEIVALGGGGND